MSEADGQVDIDDLPRGNLKELDLEQAEVIDELNDRVAKLEVRQDEADRTRRDLVSRLHDVDDRSEKATDMAQSAVRLVYNGGETPDYET